MRYLRATRTEIFVAARGTDELDPTSQTVQAGIYAGPFLMKSLLAVTSCGRR